MTAHPEMEITLVDGSSFDCKDEFYYGKKTAEKFCALATQKRPTLVYGTHQFCAAFATAMAQAGINIPEDVSIISGEDCALIRYQPVPVTVFATNFFESGRRALELLCGIIEKKHTPAEAAAMAAAQPMKTCLIERNSVKNINDLQQQEQL